MNETSNLSFDEVIQPTMRTHKELDNWILRQPGLDGLVVESSIPTNY